MAPQRERIQADLRGLLSGEVFCEDPLTLLYASDASVYQVRPLGVVRPKGLADVRALVRYAREQEIPLIPRGAGSGLAGESLGSGLVVDFSRAMRRIIGVEGDTVTVQPGVVLGQLNRYLAAFGRQFGPDPATGSVTTMGSVVALDNSGSNWLRHGSARNHVVSLQVVLADGEVLEAGQHPVTDDPHQDPNPVRRDLVRRLAELIERERETIERHWPKAWVNRLGYHLNDVLQQGKLDLARLITGSEGTLALITQATLRTVPIPRQRGVALLFFDRLESAAIAATGARALGLAACDLIDRRILSLARDTDEHFARVIPRDTEAMLMIEQQDEDQRVVLESLQQAIALWQRKQRLAFGFHLALSPDEFDAFRRLPRRVSPTLYRIQGQQRPTPFVEDIAVPPSALPEFLVALQNILKNQQVTASFFAHAGHGQLHIRPFLDLTQAADVQKMQALADELYAEVLRVGGTISGEHGSGLSRTWFMQRQFGPLYDVFREVKRIFDSHNIFNPGKVVAESPHLLTQNLRPHHDLAIAAEAESNLADLPEAEPGDLPQLAKPLELHLVWNGTLPSLAGSCNGCGRCRTQSPEARMCPIFRFSPSEEASPRAKANLMRAVVAGELDPLDLTKNELKNIADLCVNCHQCRLECPAGVDIPKLMIEAKAQYVASNGLDTTDWVLSRLETVARWSSRLAPLTNWMMHHRGARWLLEKLIGIAQGRKLPTVAAASFLRRAERRRLTRPTRRTGGKVLYFVDLYANWYDVQLAEALVAVMEHNNIAVYVHPQQQSAGMNRIAIGDVERAREVAARNIRLLAEGVRQGYEIVCSEPTAVLCLTREYPDLLDDDDARLVAAHTHDACAYLWKLHESGKLALNFQPLDLTLGYHLPCHLKALEVGAPGQRLLELIKGVTVRRIERGCSGMAGTFGLKRDNYRASLRAGWGLIRAMRHPGIQLGTTECSACKIQMEQGTTKPTIHPLKILALAYGIMPEIAPLLTAKSEELTVT